MSIQTVICYIVVVLDGAASITRIDVVDYIFLALMKDCSIKQIYYEYPNENKGPLTYAYEADIHAIEKKKGRIK